jgi:hypothetical protein
MPERRSTHRDATGQGVASVGCLHCKRIVIAGTIGILGRPRKAPIAPCDAAAPRARTVSAALISHGVPTRCQGSRFGLATTLLLGRRIARTSV